MNLVLFVVVAGFCVILFALTRQQSRGSSVGQEKTKALSELILSMEQRQEALTERLDRMERTNAERFAELEQQWQDAQESIQRKIELAGSHSTPHMDHLVIADKAVSDVPDGSTAGRRIRSLASGKYARALAMSREGISMEQIARETGIGVGEVEVVVGLAKREDGV